MIVNRDAYARTLSAVLDGQAPSMLDVDGAPAYRVGPVQPESEAGPGYVVVRFERNWPDIYPEADALAFAQAMSRGTTASKALASAILHALELVERHRASLIPSEAKTPEPETSADVPEDEDTDEPPTNSQPEATTGQDIAEDAGMEDAEAADGEEEPHE
jgi:hypothetical protein